MLLFKYHTKFVDNCKVMFENTLKCKPRIRRIIGINEVDTHLYIHETIPVSWLMISKSVIRTIAIRVIEYFKIGNGNDQPRRIIVIVEQQLTLQAPMFTNAFVIAFITTFRFGIHKTIKYGFKKRLHDLAEGNRTMYHVFRVDTNLIFC